MLDNYDPNALCWPAEGKQIIELTLLQWDYTKTLQHVVQGNLSGLDAVGFAIHQTYDDLPEDEDSIPFIELTNPGGETLLCSDDGNRGEEWFSGLVVKAEIVSIGDAFPSNTSPHCDVMNRPKKECGCPDCGPSLLG